MGFVIAVVVVMALGSGIVIGLVIGYEHPVGDLRVDQSDPTSAPYLFLELDKDVNAIMSKKYVSFRVKLVNFIPHK